MESVSDVSDEAVFRATGRRWPEWRAVLDEAGARDWPHKAIVAYLKSAHALSPWWQQMVTVGYEKACGRRITGQTAATGFQIGVRRSFPLTVEETWQRLVAPHGIEIWLGDVASPTLAAGERYVTREGIRGEIRVVKPNDRLRLTWQPADWDQPSTLQIALVSASPAKTAVVFHHEKLASAERRDEMRQRWRGALDRLLAAVALG